MSFTDCEYHLVILMNTILEDPLMDQMLGEWNDYLHFIYKWQRHFENIYIARSIFTLLCGKVLCYTLCHFYASRAQSDNATETPNPSN